MAQNYQYIFIFLSQYCVQKYLVCNGPKVNIYRSNKTPKIRIETGNNDGALYGTRKDNFKLNLALNLTKKRTIARESPKKIDLMKFVL